MGERLVSRGFFGRRRQPEQAGRIPPGQYLVDDWPVLSAGPTPRTRLDQWRLTTMSGIVRNGSRAFGSKSGSSSDSGKPLATIGAAIPGRKSATAATDGGCAALADRYGCRDRARNASGQDLHDRASRMDGPS